MGINRKYKDNHRFIFEQTGGIAKWTGLSDEGIRLYERSGLLYPEKDQQNKYRSFDAMDLTMLLYGMVYRDSGFSLKQTESLANDCSLEEVHEAYCLKYEERLREWEKERWRLERLEEMAADIEAAKVSLGECEIVTSPPLYRTEFMYQGQIVGDAQKQAIVRTWMKDHLPFAMLSTRYYSDMLGLPREEIRSCSGLGIYAKYADMLGIEENEHVKYYPPVRAVHTILSANNEMLNPDYTKALRYIEENHLRVCGDPLSFGIANLHFNKTFERYYHIWIPVEDNV